MIFFLLFIYWTGLASGPDANPRPAPALLAAVLSALMRLTSYVLVLASSIHLYVLLSRSRMRQ